MPLLMPGGRFARHQTLIFHRVLSSVDNMMPEEPTVEWFDELIEYLSQNFNIIPLKDAIKLATEKRLPRASLSITFDDGYADNFTNALPILQKHSAHATFFVASRFLNGGRMWNDTIIETARNLPYGEYALHCFDEDKQIIQSDADRRKLASSVISYCKYLPIKERDEQVANFATYSNAILPNNLMMNSDQLREMAASSCAEIGAHTQNHPILKICTPQQVREELINGMVDIEQITGNRPTLFAYPNGKRDIDYKSEQVAFVKEVGLQGAVSTDWGVLTAGTDRFQVPRFTPWSRKPQRFMFDLLRARYGLL